MVHFWLGSNRPTFVGAIWAEDGKVGVRHGDVGVGWHDAV